MKRPASFEAEGSRPAQVSRPISITVEDEDEFCLAVQQYKEQSGRQFPTCSELLEILKSIGYAKRIWKPVAPWNPTGGQSSKERVGGRDSHGVVGWYSSVETHLNL